MQRLGKAEALHVTLHHTERLWPNHGHGRQVYGIKRLLPEKLQIVLVSATLPEEAELCGAGSEDPQCFLFFQLFQVNFQVVNSEKPGHIFLEKQKKALAWRKILIWCRNTFILWGRYLNNDNEKLILSNQIGDENWNNNSWCYKSTSSPQVLELTADFMKKPFRLLVKRDELSLHAIQQFYVAVNKELADHIESCVWLLALSQE